MNTATIEEITYIMKEAKSKNLPRPIFFLGAGASKTGGIPLSNEIISHILKKYKSNPRIKSLPIEERTYQKLMECLSPNERNKLLKGYIENSKINVTHIYLAQLIINEYVDYVLTVNFDDLILRALALFGVFPPTYDMAILKDLTTTTFKKKSVIYLHGQYHGLWLLNTKEEFAIIKEVIAPIFHSIKNERPWIFLGYSGNDPIFQHIINLGRFDNGLYWVSHYDEIPSQSVCSQLLEKPNTNSYLIQDYDADSFMLKLNLELKLTQPDIINKPFTSIQTLLENIVDIEDDEYFKGVKQRLEIAKDQVKIAIHQFELGDVESSEKLKVNIKIDLLKKEIISLILQENYQEDKINQVLQKGKSLKNAEINNLLSKLLCNNGLELCRLGDSKKEKEMETMYNLAFEKFKTATEIDINDHSAYNIWGFRLGKLAETKHDKKEKLTLISKAIEKFQKAISLIPEFPHALNNLGYYLGKQAEVIGDKKDDSLFYRAFENFEKAIIAKPKYHIPLRNWGFYLGRLAKLKSGNEALKLYNKAFEKFKLAIENKSDYHGALIQWGNCLGDLAGTYNGNEAENLYSKAFEKFKLAIEIKSDNYYAYRSWGFYLGRLARIKNKTEIDDIYNQAFEKFKKAIEIKHDYSEAFENWGFFTVKFAETKSGNEALKLYNKAFEKFKLAIENKSDYYGALIQWGNCLGDLAGTYNGNEAENLYSKAFEKFKLAIEIKSDNYYAYRSWGFYLGRLARIKNKTEIDDIYNQAFEKFKKAIEIKHDYSEAFENWGFFTVKFAETKSGKIAISLYNKAFKMFEKAIGINPNDSYAYSNWGIALAKFAHYKSSKVAEELYEQGLEKINKAIKLRERYYNLACLYALKKDKTNAIKYLKKSLEKNELNVEIIKNDCDWKDLINDKDVKEILSRFEKE